MKLMTARITNFRSVTDSGEFSLHGTTCLVGKNESGKTTVLRALERINPVDQSQKKFNRDLEYPRSYLAEYDARHPGGPAVAITTRWQLDDADLQAIEAALGPNALTSTEIVVSKAYEEDATRWRVPVDEQRVAQWLMERAGVKATERRQVGPVTGREFVAKVAAMPEASADLKAASAAMAKFRDSSPHKYALDLLAPRMPKFLYFSSYDRMDGRLHPATIQHKKAHGQALTAGEELFLDFLAFAGTNIDQVVASETLEQLKAKVESASIAISKQIFSYWSQNRNLKVEFSLETGRPGDQAPFNNGNVMHVRIRNKIHDMTVPFDDRSAGFTWFFSFLVKFSQVKKSAGNVIILLDEPGLTLHAKAQSDLLRYIKEKLEPDHQVIYTTHSPFMVPTSNLLSVRTVEDVVLARSDGEQEVLGTKVGDEVLSSDRDTLFPLQGALGYEISQSLFVGEHTLLVEGPSDLLYIQAVSAALKASGRTSLDPRWTVCPTGGVDKVSAFISLFGGNRLHVAALLDFATGQKNAVGKLRESGLIRAGHVFLATDFCGQAEADTEDMLGEPLFLEIVNAAYGVPQEKALMPGKLPVPEAGGGRVVKRVEAAMRLIPGVPEFDHFLQASWLIQNPQVLTTAAAAPALDSFEKLFAALNALLPR